MDSAEKHRVYNRERYHSDPEVRARAIANAKKWRLANPEKVRARPDTWRQKNRDKVNARRRASYAKNPEKRKQYLREYREKHREELRAKERAKWASRDNSLKLRKHREWNAANKDHVKQKRREYYLRNRRRLLDGRRQWAKDHPDLRRALMKSWRLRNVEREKESKKQWAAKNHDRVLEHKARYRFKYRESINEWQRNRHRQTVAKLMTKVDSICYLCGKVLDLETQEVEIDHYIPVKANGPSTEDNLFPTHKRCNRRKNSKMPWEVNFKEAA